MCKHGRWEGYTYGKVRARTIDMLNLVDAVVHHERARAKAQRSDEYVLRHLNNFIDLEGRLFNNGCTPASGHHSASTLGTKRIRFAWGILW